MKELKKGTSLYHGTRWQTGSLEWWTNAESPFPNKVGEDGGISFTLDPDATPKVKNANMILEYTLAKDIAARECGSKGEFHAILQNDHLAVVYTKKEEEVVIHPDALGHYLEKQVDAWPGW
jgi:hypothetical protein